MRLERYLTEARSKEIPLEKAWKIAPQYMDAINAYKKKNNYMMRGLQSSMNYESNNDYRGNFLVVQPSKHERRSAYALGNYYTLLLDNLPKWNKYPKRSRSIVCTTDRDKATKYTSQGSLYYVFPKNGSKIGVCPKDDIFYSFKDIRNLGTFTSTCSSEGLDDSSWKNLIKSTNKFDDLFDSENISGSYFNESIRNFTELYKKHERLMLVFANIFDPDYNDFELTTKIPRVSGYETWTDGDCLMVQEDEIEEFMEGL